jgi:hypothetical protein
VTLAAAFVVIGLRRVEQTLSTSGADRRDSGTVVGQPRNLRGAGDRRPRGSLKHYDPMNGLPSPPEPRALPAPISNVPDLDAWIPLIAQMQYWTNRAFVNTLFTTITG